MKKLGIDIGSTTLKCVLLDAGGGILYKTYQRHYSRVAETLERILAEITPFVGEDPVATALSGSAGMGIAEKAKIPFVQEVFAEQIAVKKFVPATDVVIELGGEDAKILFLTGGFEMRMNGTCAGGTGAFIDQMATLMNLSPDEMNELAARRETLYTIASRCGVFAKSDIQPLLNQGARKEDVSASIFRAVVNQTIAGLAQGREIKGNVLYLGGPLTFLSELRNSFDEVLNTKGVCPEHSLYYVALGAAQADVGEEMTVALLGERLRSGFAGQNYNREQPLFTSREEYETFRERHEKASRGIRERTDPAGEWYLGIDAGSTTVKAVLCDRDGNVFEPFYVLNNGNPVPLVKGYLEELHRKYPDLCIRSGAVTGYGEEIIKNAFDIPFGIVETVAHYTAAKKFQPDVDFILDIGGQDIKCFRVRNGAIDSIYLNEACSSGCGSFLHTFAGALGYSSEEFSELALFAKAPVDLGSRCTVFMNSAVKQAQKDGAGVEDIAAGLSMSVVKNALYKVIRVAKTESLGSHIVVQGGTFLSDAVLRAFEKEFGHDVVRPAYAPIMGAYGAALYALSHTGAESTRTIDLAERLGKFRHEVRAISCKGCTNHCSLTVNTFADGKRYIAGNRCDRALDLTAKVKHYDLYDEKLKLLKTFCRNEREEGKPTVGIPMGLNLYELLPFWYTFFRTLGFNVIVSPFSTREIYTEGQHTIPSDTACYPAKLMHGHIEKLLRERPDAIFYPDMSYNVEEHLGINHYNCPVVAYYPQVLKMNIPGLSEIPFICDFISLADPAQFLRRIREILPKYFPSVDKTRFRQAADEAYRAYREYLAQIRQKAEEFLAVAEKEKRPVIVLCGRPYHVDPEINHGISALICRLGAVVLTEDSVSDRIRAFPTKVRNQWTYLARLYAAAKFVAEAPKRQNVNLVQLVSFGCGVDAITTDEVRAIVEGAGKIYTQIKIDEISNMGAVNIRLRSLFSAIRDKEAAPALP